MSLWEHTHKHTHTHTVRAALYRVVWYLHSLQGGDQADQGKDSRRVHSSWSRKLSPILGSAGQSRFGDKLLSC